MTPLPSWPRLAAVERECYPSLSALYRELARPTPRLPGVEPRLRPPKWGRRS